MMMMYNRNRDDQELASNGEEGHSIEEMNELLSIFDNRKRLRYL